ncbi:energy transducer TonB [Pedobacter montanisoli]|uniref:Energy transducer TonB n=1 Tax=Pedobacter montanisoli TaxID=2923277 RepID=A0ABS9ZS33_9SPHI|nr:energy transducer TonB [Pedobacter montanisoli]MCJ0741381.1 energy transducer TonB [Pedobacter montanisoli]
MRYLFSFLFILIKLQIFAQVTKVNPKDLSGSWIKAEISYLDGTELPDNNVLKYNYIKYTFQSPDILYVSTVYKNLGNENRYKIKGNMLYIMTPADFVINSFRIFEMNNQKLVLFESTGSSHEDPKALKYTFFSEQYFKDQLPLSKSDIYLITKNDTIYNTSQKIYPGFTGNNLQSFMYNELSDKKRREGTHIVSFIVNKKGQIDSLKTLESISPQYQEMFEKAFKKTKNMWSPAYLNGKPVSVLMYCKLKYYGKEIMNDFFNTQKANQAYQDKNYELAIFYYSEAIEVNPEDTDNLYKRGLCKQALGNLAGACDDWKKAEKLGSTATPPLIQKYCN